MVVGLNGCFDRLHAGHLFLLGVAYTLADGGPVLVGINNDEYLRRVKGLNTQDSATRMKALLDSKIVTLVKVFNEDNPLEFIKSINPDIYLIGEEYKGKAPEEAYLKANNIKIHYVPRVGSWSSTKLRDSE